MGSSIQVQHLQQQVIIMFGKFLDILVRLTNVKIEKKVLTKPIGITDWELSDTSNVVFEIYITNFKTLNDGHAPFYFWVHGDTYDEAAEMAIIRLMKSLVWSYKIKVKKWLRLG